MPWWGWIVLGAALLAAESVVDAQFFLVFFGAAALITGALAALGLAGPVWLQWTIFGALCVVGALTFRRRLYERIRSSAGEVGQSTVGELAVVREPIAPAGADRWSCAARSGARTTPAPRRSPRARPRAWRASPASSSSSTATPDPEPAQEDPGWTRSS